MIPVGTNADAYDRYLCRMEEIEQSLRICEQCLDNLPDGPVNVEDRQITKPQKENEYTTNEDLMTHPSYARRLSIPPGRTSKSMI